jgi:hypothetical protein
VLACVGAAAKLTGWNILLDLVMHHVTLHVVIGHHRISELELHLVALLHVRFRGGGVYSSRVGCVAAVGLVRWIGGVFAVVGHLHWAALLWKVI